jgi:membrane associated rhomboid family serine protease
MNPIKVIAAILIIGGVLGLAYGGFTYSHTSTVAQVGPISINAEHQHTVNVPMWAGVGGIVVGVLLLVLGGKRE